MVDLILTQNRSRSACAVEEPERTPRPQTRTRRARLANEALAVIDAHHRAPLTVDAVAAQVFTSRRQLQRVLIEEAGLTFREAYQRARISRARILLAEGELSVWQVAERVGYRSRSEFTKAFRSMTGELPSRVRRSVREEAAQPPTSLSGTRGSATPHGLAPSCLAAAPHTIA
jgi:transcriptional regulator GlxA family with amidase domain